MFAEQKQVTVSLPVVAGAPLSFCLAKEFVKQYFQLNSFMKFDPVSKHCEHKQKTKQDIDPCFSCFSSSILLDFSRMVLWCLGFEK